MMVSNRNLLIQGLFWGAMLVSGMVIQATHEPGNGDGFRLAGDSTSLKDRVRVDVKKLEKNSWDQDVMFYFSEGSLGVCRTWWDFWSDIQENGTADTASMSKIRKQMTNYWWAILEICLRTKLEHDFCVQIVHMFKTNHVSLCDNLPRQSMCESCDKAVLLSSLKFIVDVRCRCVSKYRTLQKPLKWCALL